MIQPQVMKADDEKEKKKFNRLKLYFNDTKPQTYIFGYTYMKLYIYSAWLELQAGLSVGCSVGLSAHNLFFYWPTRSE